MSLRYAHLNILLAGDGQARALYRLEPVSYPYLAHADKLALLSAWMRWLLASRVDWSLWRVFRGYPAARYPAEAQAMLDPRRQDPAIWEAYLAGHARTLATAQPYHPEIYLAVRLSRAEAQGFWADARRALGRARRRIERAGGVEAPRPIAATELRALEAAEREALGRLSGAGLRARRARTAEIQWLLRRTASRGVAEPPMDPHWHPGAIEVGDGDGLFLEPLGSDLIRLAGAEVWEGRRWLSVRGDLDLPESHQAMFAVGSLPESPEFPGRMAELLSAPLDDLDFPVDAVVHARCLDNAQAMRTVRRRIIDADHLHAEQLQSPHGPLSARSGEASALGREVLDYLGGEGTPPLYVGRILLAVGAPDPESLAERVRALRDSYGTVRLERPSGLQGRLYEEHELRADGGALGEYAQHLTIDQVAGLMPLSTQIVGHEHGAYLGYTTAGRGAPVFFDPTAESRRDRPPGMFLAGTPGSGKTIAAQLIELTAFLRGSIVVDLDPKPDHGWERLAEAAPDLGVGEELRVIELSGDEAMRGLLDPMRIAEPEIREDLTSSHLMAILPRGQEQSHETPIRSAVRAAIAQGARSSLAVVDLLSQTDAAGRRAARDLGVWAESGVGALGFAPEDAGELDERRWGARLTTIRMQYLALPAPEVRRADWDQSERLGMATLRLVATLAMRIARDPSVHGLVGADEAHALTLSGGAVGRRFVGDLLRLGRSQNTTLLLASQLVGDLGELRGMLGTLLMFGQRDEAEARAALEALGLDPGSAALRQQLLGYRRGLCLMCDAEDRRAAVQVHVPDERILAALNTTPAAAAPAGAAEAVGA